MPLNQSNEGRYLQLRGGHRCYPASEDVGQTGVLECPRLGEEEGEEEEGPPVYPPLHDVLRLAPLPEQTYPCPGECGNEQVCELLDAEEELYAVVEGDSYDRGEEQDAAELDLAHLVIAYLFEECVVAPRI